MKSEEEINWNYGWSDANLQRKHPWKRRSWTFQSKPSTNESKTMRGGLKFKNVVVGIWLFIEVYIIDWWNRKYAKVKCKGESLLALMKFGKGWEGMIKEARNVSPLIETNRCSTMNLMKERISETRKVEVNRNAWYKPTW